MTELHKSQLSGGQLLDDIHINAAQALIKQQFPEIGGLCNTLMQNSLLNNTSISGYPSLQVVFIPMGKVGHWIGLSTLGCKDNEVEVYDTLQNVPSLETQITICQYKSKSSSIMIKLINLATQKGSADCGLYAIAALSTLAFGNDPTKIVYHQNEMCPHLRQCFESGTITEFPIILLQKRRIKERIISIIECPIYCICRLPAESEDTVMIQCDKCQLWYHVQCLKYKKSFSNSCIKWLIEW